MVSSRPKQGTGTFSKFFTCSNDFTTQKVYLLAVNASLRWLNNVVGVYLAHFPCFLLVWDISSGIGPCFPLAGGLCRFYANAGGKQPMQRQLLLVQYKQQANPNLSVHNYTPLVISRMTK
jgi:hypothetical protein